MNTGARQDLRVGVRIRFFRCRTPLECPPPSGIFRKGKIEVEVEFDGLTTDFGVVISK